jgi:hypothetical protein
MISNKPAEPQASPTSDAKVDKADTSVAVLKPGDEIEVASGGTGTITDPPATGAKPPGYADLDLFA